MTLNSTFVVALRGALSRSMSAPGEGMQLVGDSDTDTFGPGQDIVNLLAWCEDEPAACEPTNMKVDWSILMDSAHGWKRRWANAMRRRFAAKRTQSMILAPSCLYLGLLIAILGGGL